MRLDKSAATSLAVQQLVPLAVLFGRVLRRHMRDDAWIQAHKLLLGVALDRISGRVVIADLLALLFGLGGDKGVEFERPSMLLYGCGAVRRVRDDQRGEACPLLPYAKSRS